MKNFALTITSILTLSACFTSNEQSVAINHTLNTPKNIIMVISDGMGPAYTTAYRYYNDDPSTEAIEETIFDRIVIGSASTYPVPSISGIVTDSAAAATALSTGTKSYNGAIGVDANKQPLETVLEFAKKQGKKTGIVVTSQINHATPAAYLTHNESRKNYNEIADSYIDNGIKADVYLGGGWRYFIREDRDLVNEFKEEKFQYVDTYEQLSSINKASPVLGLFGDSGLPWSLDDTNKHRLSLMTKAAIEQLNNDNGYFLLVEASQVDWAGHSNDIANAMHEMADLDITMQYLENYVKQNPDTLVILTADHSTGGLTIGANGVYEWHPEILRTMTKSPSTIADILSNSDITQELATNLLNFNVTTEETQQLQATKYQTIEALADYQNNKTPSAKKKKPNVQKAIYVSLKKIIDTRTNTGWTSGGHTAVDVPVHAMGPSKNEFIGKIDNTDIAKTIFTLLGK